MEKIIVKRCEYCLSEKALTYIHGHLYKYYVSNKKPIFFNGDQVVNVDNANEYIVLVRANSNENDLMKGYIYSKVDLGDEYTILRGRINFDNNIITNQYGWYDLYNKETIDVIKKLGVEAADNGCVFEIIEEQSQYVHYRSFDSGEDEKDKRQKELRRQYLIKNCEIDRRCARELYRDFGIVIHPS